MEGAAVFKTFKIPFMKAEPLWLNHFPQSPISEYHHNGEWVLAWFLVTNIQIMANAKTKFLENFLLEYNLLFVK
jgi:hypothetical protein